MKITGLLLNKSMIVDEMPSVLLVGGLAAESLIESISFWKVYNKEHEFPGPCYVVYLEGNNRIIIDKKAVVLVTTEVEKKKTDDTEANVKLPE